MMNDDPFAWRRRYSKTSGQLKNVGATTAVESTCSKAWDVFLPLAHYWPNVRSVFS
jgi:hypothetical protein